MANCVERTLGSEAVDYIRESLGRGMSLAAGLLREHDLDTGNVVTCVSEGVPEERMTMFRVGGVVTPDPGAQVIIVPGGRMEPIPNTDPWLASVIRDFVRGAAGRVCILENESARASDPWLKRARSRVMTCEEEVYHVVLSGNSEELEITAALREASSFAPPIMGALTEWAGDSVPPDAERTISAEQLAGMARMAEAVIAGAYDNESYLIWRRPA